MPLSAPTLMVSARHSRLFIHDTPTSMLRSVRVALLGPLQHHFGSLYPYRR